MRLGTPRLGKWKPCLIDNCSALVLTCGNRKRCDDCRRALWRAEASQKATRGYVRKVPVYQESAATIDARFQAALAQVKRTPRETLIGWSSPLARIV